MDYTQASIIEIVYNIILEKGEPTNAKEAIEKALELKGVSDPSGMITTQAYMDINSCGLFVFCGDGLWDLKTRQSLEVYDRDGSSFATGEGVSREDEIAAEQNHEIPDDYLNEDDEEDDEDSDEEKDDEDSESSEYEPEYDEDYDPTDDDDDEDYLDEKKYNDIMDDYEDMYDDKN